MGTGDSGAEHSFGGELLRLLVEDVRDFAIFALDPGGKVSAWTAGAGRMFGWDEAEILGRDGAVLFTPEDRDAGVPEQQLAAARSSGRAGDERWHLRKDGTRFFASGVVVPITRGGTLRGYGKVCRDATERRNAEAALRESEERQRKLADNLPNGFIYQVAHAPDGGRRFTYVSAGVEAVCGLSPAEALADPLALYRMVLEEDVPGLAAAEEEAYRAGRPFDHRFRVRTRAGAVRWLHCRSASRPLPDGAGVWDGLAMDVTDQEAAEEALREADRRKDQFMAVLAHELRNPLAPVRNALELLRLKADDAGAVARVREMLERQVGNLVRLVDDLLDVSRITTGKVRLQARRVDLSAVVRQAAADARPGFDAKGVALRAPEPPLAWVHGDPTRLAQVLDNLLANALKFTPAGGEVALALAELPGGRAVLTVRDTGAGIEPDMLARLFVPFSQADRTLDRSQGGLGLGLAIVKGLAELHGGEVRAESAGHGRGTAFVVTLPTVAGSGGEADEGDEGTAAAGRLRVLVVEDSPDAAESLRMLLEEYGHEVEVASTGQEGVRAAARWRPQVVICDIGLPGMDGFAVAAAIRRFPPTAAARLIALSGYGQDADKQKGRESGFDEYLTKPADPAALRAMLARLR
jgi:PAS domain S-box-containing protein